MNKLRNIVKSIFHSLIIAGVVILTIGMYYWVIKAGIPYQDPPEELRIQYAVNMGIGDELIKDGAIISIAGVIGRVIVYLIGKKSVKGL
ncbi:hypothetical protein [Butyrivibrio sp. INlla16]|uniref:hypothetical protein n=1 Tax=Butyrivibrio sp. INlla16 TaxID=1520807 RepID=UPI0008872444|nr:hypothetical protein [Butyrivibrio sp. INlla16]SDB13351.1 hypothetical protein SAMN02910263_00609 [Butyrivibrio sp. INlla16]